MDHTAFDMSARVGEWIRSTDTYLFDQIYFHIIKMYLKRNTIEFYVGWHDGYVNALEDINSGICIWEFKM